MKLLREWRTLTGGAGVPTLVHGSETVVGFNAERYEQVVDCCEHSTDVDVDRLERDLAEAEL